MTPDVENVLEALQEFMEDLSCDLYLQELKSPYRKEVEECSRVTGISISEILNESIEEWLETWGALHMDRAEKKQRGSRTATLRNNLVVMPVGQRI